MLTIGTRGSDLALWQAHHVQGLLRERAGLVAEIHIISTEGDRVQDRRLDELSAVGVFTKEIEAALLAGEVDVAVHSHKDLPTEGPDGLTIAAVPGRGPVRECLLVRPEAHRPDAPGLPLVDGARVGTGSARRRAQLRALRPDLELADLRGNVPTRIARLAAPATGAERVDAIVLAEAGLVRLGIDPAPLVMEMLDVEVFIPAPAQGALAVQVRSDGVVPAAAHADGGRDDGSLAAALAPLQDAVTARCVTAERNVLAALEGGCNLPLGVHVRPAGDELHLLAALGRADGRLDRCEVRGPDP
jgi:hydroxymethylbilane synthase